MIRRLERLSYDVSDEALHLCWAGGLSHLPHLCKVEQICAPLQRRVVEQICAPLQRRVITAADVDGYTAGIFCYAFVGSLRRRILARGTWVAPEWRRHGLARLLWSYALSTTQAVEVVVSVVSDRGMTLVEAMRRHWPRLCWLVEQDGNRLLRVLAA